MNRFVQLLSLFVVIVSIETADNRYRKMFRLDENEVDCSPAMPCTWAVCPWQRTFRISEEFCNIFENHCTCPPNKVCALTNDMDPGRDEVTFVYRCQNPRVEMAN